MRLEDDSVSVIRKSFIFLRCLIPTEYNSMSIAPAGKYYNSNWFLATFSIAPPDMPPPSRLASIPKCTLRVRRLIPSSRNLHRQRVKTSSDTQQSGRFLAGGRPNSRQITPTTRLSLFSLLPLLPLLALLHPPHPSLSLSGAMSDRDDPIVFG